ncbi:MAG: DegT/DnrJ/EryC1/StrS family aminotransferase [Patescibacteria group bacterium]
MKVPFNDLSRRAALHKSELVRVLERVAASGWYILGPEVKAFEEAFASFIGVKHVVGVNSGTDALALALRALGVGAGDEVVTVGNTATATVAAIRMAGATPIFADILDDYTMNPADFERRITPKTKAVIPVHLYGFPADMEQICAIAEKRGIKVLEDAAQAHGATIGEKQVGTFGDVSAFSFYPTKNLGALGDGGAVATNDMTLAERVRRLRQYGWAKRDDAAEEGVNSRLDEIQAALLTWALPHLSAWNGRRTEVAERYRSGITNPAVVLPSEKEGTRQGVWHLFEVQVDDRARFTKHMEERGIGTAIHYSTPIYRMKGYGFLGVDPGEYPVTERITPRIVSLPMFPELTDAEVDAVIEAVNAY